MSTQTIDRLGGFRTAMVASEKDYVATRVAHKLDLTGPALSIHTACSTSLVAIVVLMIMRPQGLFRWGPRARKLAP